MPKPPEILVKIIAWILVIAGPVLFLYIALMPWDAIGSFYYISVSLLMFSAGAVNLNFKGSKFYKVILGTTTVIIIPLTFMGMISGGG